MTWKPITDAPRDGSWLLLKGGSMDYDWDGESEPPAVVGQYIEVTTGGAREGCWQFAWYDSGYYGEYRNPTHFMSLDDVL